MGGGTHSGPWQETVTVGLSPRGRGNHHPRALIPARPRTIPAWAGEPEVQECAVWAVQDYPRVGGGTRVRHCTPPSNHGLSPRGRGNLTWWKDTVGCLRTIPAWAGEPSWAWRTGRNTADYPRVGGGTRMAFLRACSKPGLSPRGRGNLLPFIHTLFGQGTIPAWAGEPPSRGLFLSANADYPRVGGGTPTSTMLRMSYTGLSPRGRGNPLKAVPLIPCPRTIPAWAGEPFPPTFTIWPFSDYPRVGGGTPGSETAHSS